MDLNIDQNWHTYLSVGPDSTSPVTKVSFELPDGVRKVGKLREPVGRPYPEDPESMILTGRARFAQQFAMSDKAGGKITVKVRYQACDDEKCLRPATKTLTVDLPKILRRSIVPPHERGDGEGTKVRRKERGC